MFNNLSTQARLVLMTYVLVAVTLFVPYKNYVDTLVLTETTDKDLSFNSKFIYIFATLIPMLVTVYTINCLTKGSAYGGRMCNVISWFHCLSIILLPVLSSIFILICWITSKTTKTVPNLSYEKESINVQQGSSLKSELLV